MSLRRIIVNWLFPNAPQKDIDELIKRPEKRPVKVWQSNDLEIDEENKRKAEEEENKLPHPVEWKEYLANRRISQRNM